MSKNKCNKCKKQVTTKGISCDGCQSWFHASCVNIKEDELTFLGSNKASKWFCRQCLPDINEVLKNLQKFKDAGTFVKELEQKLERRLQKVEEQQNEANEEMREKLKVIQVDNCVDNSVAVDAALNGTSENAGRQRKVEDIVHKQLKGLHRDNVRLECELDSQEQYERRDCVTVYGVREMGLRENLHSFALEFCSVLGGSVTPLDISVCHRLGKQSNKPRPVIIKFTRRYVKTQVMRNKYKLKNLRGWEAIFIEENLTVWRRHFINELKSQRGVEKVATYDGKILFVKDSRRYVINSGVDFLNLLDSGLLEDDLYTNVGINPKLRHTDETDEPVK